MHWFNNLKIKVKLIISFVIVALFTVIVGVFGITTMNTLNQRSNEMYTNNYIPSSQLNDIQTNLLLIRSNFLLMIYEKNVSQQSTRIDQIFKWADENIKLLNEYGTGKLTVEERQLYNQFVEDAKPYQQYRAETVKLLQAGKYAEAEALGPEFTKAREKVEKDIDQLIQLNKQYAQAINQKNAAEYAANSTMMMVIIVIAVALAIVFGLMIATLISKPLAQLVQAAHKIATGDLDVDVTVNSKDEVGMLAGAFKSMADNINEVMTNINVAAEQVAAGSKQVSDASTELSQGATEQASSIEELTASVEEISAQTQQNAESANEANTLAEAAKQNAMQGNSQMQEMLKAMTEINDASSSISKIIKVIDEIAFQTNILALNAAVEAARAGQHGKGFAVVAEEVRNLAARSANAAKETTTMIEGSIKKVEYGTNIASDTAGALNKIVGGVTQVADIISTIAVASNEQAMGISQINQGIAQVSQVVQANSSTSEESAAASEELASQADLLSEQVSRFKLKKSNRSNYRGLEELSPDVLKMLENMAEMKKNGINKSGEAVKEAAATKMRITLSDNEFGKY